MTDERPVGDVVHLRARAGYRPDMAALARAQVASARERLGLTTAEFAEVLRPLLGWSPTPGVVENWETTATPPGDVLIAAGVIAKAAPYESPDSSEQDLMARLLGKRFADLDAVFPTRSEFLAHVPPSVLFDGAKEIRAAGLSLNLICQQYSEDQLRRQIEGGATVVCLFLAPYGKAISAREHEEGYPPGHLSSLTEMNIQILDQRVRTRLSEAARSRLEIATYDQTIRFNLVLVDGQVGVVQPYLPEARGVESPTFVLHKLGSEGGLFASFERTFAWLRDRSARIE
jgi:hypothetical protein